MLKKVASILLIITVNTLLLTGSVIFHHHHNGFPHFGCEIPADEHAEQADTSCCTGEKTEACAFEQEIILFKETGDKTLSFRNLLPEQPDSLFPALFDLLTNPFSPLPGKKLPEPPYLIACYPAGVNSGTGLRAPPAA
ncbi:MAG: hypothetical protein LBI65_03695 [Candidatus Symbiothrix sp.]|jgi:hypothetical protein|nr:hypothetical protein [Candidatus Symbiothrix sp.]